MLGPQNLFTLDRLVLIHHVALKVGDLPNGDGRDFLSIIGNDTISRGQLQQADIATAECEGQAVVWPGEGGDAQLLGHADHPLFLRSVRIVVNADEIECLYCRDIEGVGQRRAYGDRTMEAAVVIDRAIRLARVVRVAGGRKLARHIPDQSGHRPTFFEGRQVVDRLDRRPWLARRAVCHVDLPGDGFVVKVRGANHGQDLPGRGPDGDKSAVMGVVFDE